jgi:3-dehydroquinate synthase
MKPKKKISPLVCKFPSGNSTLFFTHQPIAKHDLKFGNKNSIFLITDRNVARLCLDHFCKKIGILRSRTWIIPAGETSKSMGVFRALLDWLIEQKADRSSVLIGLGGGVVGDLVGMAAATYMRGIHLVHIPTTLISQVDSSIGGKVGFNYHGYKNLIGTFYHAEKIIIAPSSLKTLPPREFKSGLAELIKMAICFDRALFNRITQNPAEMMSRQEHVLLPLIRKAIQHKIKIVQSDERELRCGSLSRKLLNFGHTIGHALESKSAFKKFNHGEAVALGMAVETSISKQLGLIRNDHCQAILKGLHLFEFNLTFPKAWIPELLELVKRDKKNESAKISMALPLRIGRAEVVDDIPLKIIHTALTEFASP